MNDNELPKSTETNANSLTQTNSNDAKKEFTSSKIALALSSDSNSIDCDKPTQVCSSFFSLLNA